MKEYSSLLLLVAMALLMGSCHQKGVQRSKGEKAKTSVISEKAVDTLSLPIEVKAKRVTI